MAGDLDKVIANRLRRYIEILAHYKGYISNNIWIYVRGAYIDNNRKRGKRLKPDRKASSSKDRQRSL